MKIGLKMMILSLTLAILPMCLVLVVTMNAMDRIADDVTIVAVKNLTEEMQGHLREVAGKHARTIRDEFLPFHDKAIEMSVGKAKAIDSDVKKLFETIDDIVPTDWKPYVSVYYVHLEKGGSADDFPLRVFAQQRYGGGRIRAYPSAEQPLASNVEIVPGIVNAIQSGQTGATHTRSKKGSMIWAYSPLDDNGQFGVVMLLQKHPSMQGMERAVSVIQEVGARVLFSTSFILVMVFLVVIFVAITSGMKLVGPIQRLASCAEKLSEGDYDVRVKIDTHDELRDLGDIFNQLGPRLREHEQAKRALALAAGIQNHMQPGSTRAIEGLEISGRTRYCDETGGDYYDIVELFEGVDGSFGLAIGDVTGHGIGAALVMASIRGGLRALMQSAGTQPGLMLSSLNRQMLMDKGINRYMTMCYLLVEPGRKVRYSSAGHVPILWFRSETGEVEVLKNTGVILGATDRNEYRESEQLLLNKGDVLVIYTDGIVEAVDHEENRFGVDRLIETLKSCHSGTAGEIENEIVDSVVGFRGENPQEDDLTIVVIKATA